MEFLRPTARIHKDWFDKNSTEMMQLLEDKHRAYKAHLDDPKSTAKQDDPKSTAKQDDPKSTAKQDVVRNIRSTIQLKLCQMQDSWLSNKADEIQGFADRNDTRNFYDGLKEFYAPAISGPPPVLSAGGSTLIPDKEKILERLAEHFENVLSRPSAIKDEAIDWLPQVLFHVTLDAEPVFEEIRKASHLLSCDKAPGADSIHAEVYKEGGTALTEKLHQLFQLIWKHESVPQDFKDTSIIYLYKCKENRQSCANRRGISLLSIAGKALARVLLNRLTVNL